MLQSKHSLRGAATFLQSGRSDRKRNQTDRRWTYRINSQYTMVTANNAKANQDAAQGTEHNTHLKRNTIAIAKQTRKYADDLDVTDIAVFDWNAMLVFDYKDTGYK